MGCFCKIIVFIAAVFILCFASNSGAASAAYIGVVSQIIAPTQIPGLALWLDAAVTSTITQSGGAVSQWNDKSGLGNNATQGTGANQPTTGADTINGKNVLKFNGTSGFLNLPSTYFTGLGTGPNTVFVVYKTSSASTQQTIYGGGASGSSVVKIQHNSTLMAAQHGSTQVTFSATMNTNAHIAGLRRSGTSIDVIYDGNLTNSANGLNETLTAVKLGNAGASTNHFLVGDLAEVAAYNVSLSNAQANLIGKYLANKWGVTWTNLP